jgi:hypothetical protein
LEKDEADFKQQLASAEQREHRHREAEVAWKVGLDREREVRRTYAESTQATKTRAHTHTHTHTHSHTHTHTLTQASLKERTEAGRAAMLSEQVSMLSEQVEEMAAIREANATKDILIAAQKDSLESRVDEHAMRESGVAEELHTTRAELAELERRYQSEVDYTHGHVYTHSPMHPASCLLHLSSASSLFQSALHVFTPANTHDTGGGAGSCSCCDVRGARRAATQPHAIERGGSHLAREGKRDIHTLAHMLLK